MIRAENNYDLSPGTSVLVTGATGFVGQMLVLQLLQAGLKVRALIRPGSSNAYLPKSVEVFRGDLTDIDSVHESAVGVELIFHLAAKLHINNPPPSSAEEYQLINVEGTRHVVSAALASKVSRLVFFSTINVYGAGSQSQVFTEDSEISPQTLYAKSKSKAEEIVLSELSTVNDDPLGTVLRLAAIYGPKMKGNYLRLLIGLKQGWFLPLGPGLNQRTLIFIDDAVQGALLAAVHPKAAGNIYNLTDGQTYSLKTIIQAMSHALDRHPPWIHLPEKPVRFGVGLLEDFSKFLEHRFPFGRDAIDAMLENRAVSGLKIQQELGFSPRVDLETGWNRVVQALKEMEH